MGQRTSRRSPRSRELPEAARAYLDFVEERVGVPVTMVGDRPAPRPDAHPARARSRPPDRRGRPVTTPLRFRPFALTPGA